MKTFLFAFLFPFSALIGQTDDSWKLYDDTQLGRVDITIGVDRLQWIYNHVQSDSEHYASFHFTNKWIDETYDSVGFRLRGNTSRDAKKKSFKVSFNSFIKGGRFHGVKGMNLNGEHNDPTVARSKFAFDLFRDIGMPVSRANHVRVYINGTYYGLYVSTEHIDDEFIAKNFTDDTGNLWKCLYPADLTYKGKDAAAYRSIMNNATSPAYELQTNEAAADFSRFVRFVDLLNNTPSAALADSLQTCLHVHRVLQYLAMNTLLGSWDDYRSNMNNYYLYHIPSEDKFTIIPYDYDNTFGIDWFNKTWATADPYAFPKISNGSRPLSDKLLAVDQFRDLYTHFLKFYRDKVFALPAWEGRIDSVKAMITPAASEDFYRTLDYGFTTADFNNSYSASSYQKAHVKNGLKQFVTVRNASLAAQLNDRNSGPTAYAAGHEPKRPTTDDSIVVAASCFASAGVKQVRIEFKPAQSSVLQAYEMKRAPVPNSKRVEDADRWIGTIPPLGSGNTGGYRISVRDSLERLSFYPRTGFVGLAPSAPILRSVVINEFMADNDVVPDQAGEFDDWVELFNPTASPVTLTNKFLTDDPAMLTKWKFTQPGLVIAPGGYCVIWCDEDGSQTGIHANFKLSAGGEFLALTSDDGVSLLDSVSFGPQKKNTSFGRFPNGASLWGMMQPTISASNASVTSVSSTPRIPIDFAVSAYPNPFNPSTTIRYSLPEPAEVHAAVFDMLGREVWSREAGRCAAGTHTLRWDGLDNGGSLAGSGLYVLRVRADSRIASMKLLLLK